MVWRNKMKVILVHIPKTGGTSIEVAIHTHYYRYGYGVIFTNEKNKINQIRYENLKKVCEMRSLDVTKSYALQHFTSNEYKIILGDDTFNEYFKFAICRNPYDRIVSEFFWCQIPKIGNRHGQSFDDYLQYVQKCVLDRNYYETVYHDHFMPQHEFIYDEKNNLQIDRLFKYENFDEVENFLKEELNVTNIQHLNKRSNNKKIELTDKQKELIYEIYKNDFILLNYKK